MFVDYITASSENGAVYKFAELRRTQSFDRRIQDRLRITLFLNTIYRSSSSSVSTIQRGSVAGAGSPDVGSVSLTSGAILTIKEPKVGNWTASVSDSGNYSLSVSGVSPLHLSSFNSVSEQGRPGHTAWFPLNGTIPKPGSTQLALAQIEGGFATAYFEYRTLNGTPLGTANLAIATLDHHTINSTTVGTTNNTFYGNMTVPSGDYVVYAVGTDLAGSTFQRVVPVRFVRPPAGGCNASSPEAAFRNSTVGATACNVSLPSLTLAPSAPLSTGASITANVTANCTSCSFTRTPSVLVTAGAVEKEIRTPLSTCLLVVMISIFFFL